MTSRTRHERGTIIASSPLRSASRWRRAWRRLRLSLRRPRARIVWGRGYELEIPGSAFDARRAVHILAFLHAEGLVGVHHVSRVRPAPLRALARVHDENYLEGLQTPEAMLGILGHAVDDRLQDRFLLSQREQVAGTVQATRLALSTQGVAVNLGGGFHHATRNRGQGFCAFNDVAVAIEDRRQAGFTGNVLVIDLDLHDGDGTRQIFAEDPSVHTLSIHNRDLGDVGGMESTSVALGDDVDDRAYLAAVRDHVSRVFDSVRPELVLYLAGADPARDDRLGNWRVSPEAMLERDRFVVTLARQRRRPRPLVLLLAGGYGPDAWRYPARTLAWWITGREGIEPPLATDLLLRRFRSIARGFRASELSAEPANAWDLTHSDLDPGAGSGYRRQRFLGYYSRHGIELALERYGMGDHLRRLGHRDLVVELQFDHPTSDTMRVLSGDSGESLLELRARRNDRIVPGRSLLEIEWLLLQNPVGSFSERRPRLPGQRHPGLGLLREFSAVLVLICERLGLGGMVFTPSHYHIAARGRSAFQFLEARAQARFIALQRVLERFRLDEAVRRLQAGDVIDRRTGRAVAWEPSPMVLPVAEDLRERLDSDAFSREALAALSEFDFVLRDESPSDQAP